MRTTAWMATALAGALLAMGAPTAQAQTQDEEDDLWGPEGGDTGTAGGGTATGGDLAAGEEEPLEAPAGEVMPNNFAQRDLTLPPGTLRIEANFDIWGRGYAGPDDDVGAGMGAGATIGIIDNLEAGLTLLPIVFTPDGGFGDMRMHGTYRFLDGDVFEMGGKLEMLLPTDSTDRSFMAYSVSFAAPMMLHIGENLRIDTGVEFAITILDYPGPGGSDAIFGLSAPAGTFLTQPWKRHPVMNRSAAGIPVVVNYTLMDSITFGGRAGFGVLSFEDFGDSIFMPLGFHGMYTIGGDAGPLADIGGRFRFPYFLGSDSDAVAATDVVNADIWELTIFGEIYLHELF